MPADLVRDRLQADLREAMRARDRPRTSVIRTALAALANAEAVEAQPVAMADGLYAAEVERRPLTDADIRRVLDEVRDDLVQSADELAELGRGDEAEGLRVQAGILAGYMG
jgi:uncharacterized protein YqeY